MRGFESRFERLELKYLIDEGSAGRIQRQLLPWCQQDPYSAQVQATGEGRGYAISSLYLDTPALALHRAKERGDPDRFKLRIRRYRGMSAFCVELKRRRLDTIQKTRALCDAPELRDAVVGLAPPRDPTPGARQFMEAFAARVLSLGAGPTLLVRYDREAYSSTVDRYVRITFDRNVEFQRTAAWSIDASGDAWWNLESHSVWSAPRPLVVMEIKCEAAVPEWLVAIVRSNELRRESVSKYSLGIYLTGRMLGAPQGQERARGVLR